jgi:hypothetical protein
MMTNLRRIPPAFVMVAVSQLAVVALRLGLLTAKEDSWLISTRFSLFTQGVSFAMTALLVAGALDLGRRTTGREATAARVAAGVFIAGVVLDLAFPILMYLIGDHYGPTLELVFQIDAYAWSAVMIGGFAALVIAGGGWQRSPVLASVALGAITLARLPPVLHTPLREALGMAAASYVFSLFWLTALGCTIALLACNGDRAEPAEDGVLCERGLRRVSDTLWLRVIAAAVLTGLSMMVLASRGTGGVKILQFAMIAGPAINTAAFMMVAFGAFAAARSGTRELSSSTLHAAGALSLWTAGAMLAQLPSLYRISRGDGGDTYASEVVQTFSLAIPLVGAMGIVVLVTAVAGFARQRSLTDLRDQASSRGGAFAVLMAVSMLISTYALPKATTQGQFLALSFSTAIAGLVAIVMIAKLFSLAAAAVHQAPGLPTATLRTPD